MAILLCTSAITSCSKSTGRKSNKALIEQFESTAEQLAEAAISGNEEKVEALGEKLQRIGDELDKRNLTEEEEEEVAEILNGLLYIAGAMIE